MTRQEVIDKYFTNKQMDPIEGIWTTDDGMYEIAILKNTFDGNEGYDYIGILISCRTDGWNPGETKALFKKTANSAVYPGVWYMQAKGEELTSFRIASATEITYKIRGGLLLTDKTSSIIRVYPKGASDGLGPGDQGVSSSGTGFAICPDLIATCYHVVGKHRNIDVTSFDGKTSTGTVVVKDRANDLAIIKVSGGMTFTPVTFGRPSDVRSGAKVFTIGFPLPDELGTNAKIGEGIINSATGIDDDPRTYQISIPVQPGNSGGPLVDDSGKVIGLVAATLNNKYLFFFMDTIAQNVNFAVKINYLDNMLSVLPGQPQPSLGTQGSGMDAAQILQRLRQSVALVTAYDK
jgi:serine protease Do